MARDITIGYHFERPNLDTKTSANPIDSGTLFTFTGRVGIVCILGTILVDIEAVATDTKLRIHSDALTEYDICANKDISHLHAGTLLSITGTAADAMVATDVVGTIAPGQAGTVVASCVTSGTIEVVHGHAATGQIVWDICWIPLSPGATLVAA
jgi:hypothetical protein